jgi:hypothetical protein
MTAAHGLLFVMETKIEGKRVENLKSTLGFAGGFAVDSVGLSGGIGVFWSSAAVEVKSFNKYHIDAIVQLKDNSIPSGGSLVYTVIQEERIGIIPGLL